MSAFLDDLSTYLFVGFFCGILFLLAWMLALRDICDFSMITCRRTYCQAIINDKHITETVHRRSKGRGSYTVQHHCFKVEYAFQDRHHHYKIMESSIEVHHDSYHRHEINDVIDIKYLTKNRFYSICSCGTGQCIVSSGTSCYCFCCVLQHPVHINRNHLHLLVFSDDCDSITKQCSFYLFSAIRLLIPLGFSGGVFYASSLWDTLGPLWLFLASIFWIFIFRMIGWIVSRLKNCSVRTEEKQPGEDEDVAVSKDEYELFLGKLIQDEDEDEVISLQIEQQTSQHDCDGFERIVGTFIKNADYKQQDLTEVQVNRSNGQRTHGLNPIYRDENPIKYCKRLCVQNGDECVGFLYAKHPNNHEVVAFYFDEHVFHASNEENIINDPNSTAQIYRKISNVFIGNPAEFMHCGYIDFEPEKQAFTLRCTQKRGLHHGERSLVLQSPVLPGFDALPFAVVFNAKFNNESAHGGVFWGSDDMHHDRASGNVHVIDIFRNEFKSYGDCLRGQNVPIPNEIVGDKQWKIVFERAPEEKVYCSFYLDEQQIFKNLEQIHPNQRLKCSGFIGFSVCVGTGLKVRNLRIEQYQVEGATTK